jgi:hypothetical protein
MEGDGMRVRLFLWSGSITWAAVIVVSISAVFSIPQPVWAQVQLTDQNAVLNVVTNSSAGMNSWTIDGQNVLDQQWFWYRVGNSGGQSSLDTLPSTITLSDAADLTASYTGATFVVTLTLNLSGSAPGSGNSDLGINIKIRNTSGNSLNFHLFEYSNFTLGGVPGDTVTFPNSNAVAQVGSLGTLQEAVATGLSGYLAPMHHEANLFPVTLNELTSGTPVTLDDTNSAGPGDVTWAFQWDANLSASSSTQISKDINVQVPEPGTGLLMGMGVVVLVSFFRPGRRQRF